MVASRTCRSRASVARYVSIQHLSNSRFALAERTSCSRRSAACRRCTSSNSGHRRSTRSRYRRPSCRPCSSPLSRRCGFRNLSFTAFESAGQLGYSSRATHLGRSRRNLERRRRLVRVTSEELGLCQRGNGQMSRRKDCPQYRDPTTSDSVRRNQSCSRRTDKKNGQSVTRRATIGDNRRADVVCNCTDD